MQPVAVRVAPLLPPARVGKVWTLQMRPASNKPSAAGTSVPKPRIYLHPFLG